MDRPYDASCWWVRRHALVSRTPLLRNRRHALSSAWNVDRLAEGAHSQCAVPQGIDARFGNVEILRVQLRPDATPVMLERRNESGADADVRVEHPVSFIGERQRAALDQLDRELAWVDGL